VQLVNWSAVQDKADSTVLLCDEKRPDKTLNSGSPPNEADAVKLSYEVSSQTFIVFKSFVPMGTYRVLHRGKFFRRQNDELVWRIKKSSRVIPDQLTCISGHQVALEYT
jgi:hypothetical protein